MESVLIVIHLMVVLAMIVVILLQRSEGGALGIGGGSGGFMTGRGAASALTRMTAILAVGFFVTSLLLSIIARFDQSPGSILDQVSDPGTGTQQQQDGTTGGNGILDELQDLGPAQPEAPSAGEPSVPQSQ